MVSSNNRIPLDIYLLKTTDAAINLATEEFILKNTDEDVFMLWQNEKAIVCGKHQNTLSEINYPYCIENNIAVHRRLSGGGTVFHDLGNINFSFIKKHPEKQENTIDFKQFTFPIIHYLNTLGIIAENSGRNDILIDGLKFSGNAEHLYLQKKRTLHHGTILFNSNLSELSKGLKTSEANYTDKSVKSVRSKVTNVLDYLPNKISIDEFIEGLIQCITKLYANCQLKQINSNELEEINALAKNKYQTWEWNYAYSPKYILEKKTINNHVKMEVNKGIIQSLEWRENPEFNTLLIGINHDFLSIKRAFNINHFSISDTEILDGFF